jgi:hypothetical protein
VAKQAITLNDTRKLGGADVKKSEIPEEFKSHDHMDDFIMFFSSYLKRTHKVQEMCFKIGALEPPSAFGNPKDSGHLKYFRMRYKKCI